MSRVGSNLTTSGSIGYTIVDALDTIILMRDHLPPGTYEAAEKWVADELKFDRDGKYSTFEACIVLVSVLLFLI